MSIADSNIETMGIVLLAAGASMRLGRPKQLLPHHEGRSLLQHTLQAALDSNAQPIVVVLGAYADLVQGEINHQTVRVVVNSEWKEGMASSIRCGVKNLCAISPNAVGVILMVCDQPYVTAGLLNELIAAHQNTGKPIVTCSYSGTFGPPTLFHKRLFEELQCLKGDVGARHILRQHVNYVEVIFFPDGTLDIDTEADYERIMRENVP